MADPEKHVDVDDKPSSGRQFPLTLMVPSQSSTSKSGSSHSSGKEGKSSRHSPPTRLSVELTLKVKSQMSLLKTIKTIAESVIGTHPDRTLAEPLGKTQRNSTHGCLISNCRSSTPITPHGHHSGSSSRDHGVSASQ
ncbi:hypothetical protein DMN91_011839 [Ooceraea biroi]|uniref:Uncharacterized protein n=1 Tax=Ooceraea biroi TaxID=2015173 RepID=A0A3L8D779_OOCBI|nr:hypothetical protein DMN91_011839 [Ooceraea biroi]